MDDKAYVAALVTRNYIPGLKALKRSLKKVKSKYPLYVLIPEDSDFKEELYKKHIIDDYCHLIEHENIPFNLIDNKKIQEYYWKNTFFKLTAADLCQFKKIVLIDLDMLVLKNIDLLFDKPHYSCVADWYGDYVFLNSGLMVIEPSKSFYNNLIDSIPYAIERRFKSNLMVGDQDVFRQAYPDWGKDRFLKLPKTYNIFIDILEQVHKDCNIKYKSIYVIHFAGPNKPWMHLFSVYSLKKILRMIKHLKFSSIFFYLKYCFRALL